MNNDLEELKNISACMIIAACPRIFDALIAGRNEILNIVIRHLNLPDTDDEIKEMKACINQALFNAFNIHDIKN